MTRRRRARLRVGTGLRGKVVGGSLDSDSPKLQGHLVKEIKILDYGSERTVSESSSRTVRSAPFSQLHEAYPFHCLRPLDSEVIIMSTAELWQTLTHHLPAESKEVIKRHKVPSP